MHENPTHTPAQEDCKIDSGILVLLVGDDAQRPWAVDEIEREIGDVVATTDSLRRLQAAGIVHRLDRFVWASRAALMADSIRP
jgi:hypothetical protein